MANPLTPKKLKKPKSPSTLELKFKDYWAVYGQGICLEQEAKIIEGRKYPFDFVHRESKISIEINGGIWTKSGHSSGTGLQRDYEKANLAQLEGWDAFSLSGSMINEAWITRIAEHIQTKLNKEKTRITDEEIKALGSFAERHWIQF